MPGAEVHGSHLSWDTSEFGIISHKQITETLQHVFGAKYIRSHGKRYLDFDISKLQRLGQVYDLAIEIQVSKNGNSPEHERVTDVTDVGHVQDLSSDGSDKESVGDEEESSENYDIEPQKSEDNTPEDDSKEDAHPIHLSQVSQLAPEFEDENTAKLREYDRLSALARKKSRETK